MRLARDLAMGVFYVIRDQHWRRPGRMPLAVTACDSAARVTRRMLPPARALQSASAQPRFISSANRAG